MKIVFISNNFPPISCGVGDYTYNLAKEFVKNGHKVSIICKTEHAISSRWENNGDGIEVYPFGGTWSAKDYQKVLGEIKIIKPDRILFQYVAGGFNIFAVPWLLVYFFVKLRRKGFDVVTTFHETYVRFNWSHPKYLYVAFGQRIITWAVAKLSHQLITSIDRYERQLKRWNPRVKQIPIGSNILPIPVSDAELAAIRQKIAPNGERVLSTFGIRDHRKLLELFSFIYEQDSNVVLLVVGKLRADLSQLPEKHKKQIHVTCFLEADDVFRYLKASDAFIMFDYVSEKGEGGTCNKSTSLAAAFSAGLPIFATKGDMTNKLLLESDIVWVPYSAIEITSEIVLDNLKRPMDYFSNSFYEEYLSWGKISGQYEAID